MTKEMKQLIVAPFIGGLFVVFLPFIVWPLLAHAIYKAIAEKYGHMAAPAPMAVGVAYFAGEGKEGKPTSNEKLDKLADEIQEKR
jgi:hypothetical protein